jgi:hypothetical protein
LFRRPGSLGARPILIELRHLPVEKIADELTKQKVATPRGGRWHGRTVARLLDRLHLPGLMAGWIEPGLFFRAWRFPRRARGTIFPQEIVKIGRLGSTTETEHRRWSAESAHFVSSLT